MARRKNRTHTESSLRTRLAQSASEVATAPDGAAGSDAATEPDVDGGSDPDSGSGPAEPDHVSYERELPPGVEPAVAPGTGEPAASHARSRVSRMGPHAARTAHRAHRTSVSLLFFPVFLVYVAIDALRDLIERSRRARIEEIERRPRFRRPASMPSGDARSMADITAVIESFPFRPLPLPTQLAFFRDNGADAIGALLSPNPQITGIPHMYPATFNQRLFTGAEDHRIAGMQAMHPHAGPAVVICHGLLMTKNFDMIIQLARRAYEQWGFHVVTLDLRGWGQSSWTTDAPASAGFYEGRDIVEVCRELHANPLVTSVGAIGFSLGGASVISAAHVSSLADDTPLDGGAVALCAPSDVSSALRHISTKPHWRDPFFGLWHLFRAAIKSNVRRRGLRRDLGTWYDLVAEMSAPYYGVSMEEYCARASSVNFAADITQPVLELHAMDDFLVPVEHAHRLDDATVDNPWVHVMVRESGNHCSFAAVDASWYHSTLRRWLEYWATPGADPDAHLADDPAEDSVAAVG